VAADPPSLRYGATSGRQIFDIFDRGLRVKGSGFRPEPLMSFAIVRPMQVADAA